MLFMMGIYHLKYICIALIYTMNKVENDDVKVVLNS